MDVLIWMSSTFIEESKISTIKRIAFILNDLDFHPINANIGRKSEILKGPKLGSCNTVHMPNTTILIIY